MARNVQVLLVDEALERRLAIKRQLALTDYAVVGESGFGQEALLLVKQLRPDAVIVAFEEPLARPLRTIESLAVAVPEAPVIAVSSLSDGDSIRKAMVAGARDYVVKPFTQRKLADSIHQVLEIEGRRKESRDSAGEDLEPGTVMTVFSAKGGVGKTTLATNLAVSLALLTKQRVALVDIDMQFGDAAIMMDLAPRQGIVDMARELDALDPQMLQTFLTPHESGVMLLAAPTQLDEGYTLTAEQTGAIVQELARVFDYIVVDSPPTLTESVRAALQLSTLVLMITTLEITSIKSTKMSLEMMRAHQFSPDRVKLMLNHANSANTLKSKDVEMVLGYPLFWTVPYDIDVANCGQLGQLVVQASPKSKTARTIVELARAVSGLSRGRAGVMSRLLGRAA